MNNITKRQVQILPNSDEIMLPEDVRRELRIGRDTMYRWINSGKLPQPRKLGRRCFWRSGDLWDFLQTLPTHQEAKLRSVGVRAHKCK